MLLENFILILKKRRGTIIAQNGDPAYSSCIAIAARNEQFPARLAISIAGRPHLVARLW